MKKRLALLLGFCLAAESRAQQASLPLMPPPVVPPPAAAPPPPIAPPEAGSSEAPADEEPTGPEITLGDKTTKITPGKIHDALAGGGEITVEAGPGKLTALLTGAAHAHCFIGFESIGVQNFRLVQEFEVAPVDPKDPRVVMALSGKLNGYVRGVHKGSACMRLARAAVYESGTNNAPLSLGFAPACASGSCARKYQAEYTTPEVTLPAGKYTLVVDFVIDAAASGLANGHGQADFATKAPEGLWAQTKDPFKDEDRKDFGFDLTLTAAAPGESPQTGRSPRPSPRVASRVERTSFRNPVAGSKPTR